MVTGSALVASRVAKFLVSLAAQMWKRRHEVEEFMRQHKVLRHAPAVKVHGRGLVNKLSIYAVPGGVNKFVFGSMALAERKRPHPREVCRD